MDLVDYREDIFLQLQSDFFALAAQLGIRNVLSVPISALEGDNVVSRGSRTPWYQGPTLLEHLETVPLRPAAPIDAVRFPIQYVIRPGLRVSRICRAGCQRRDSSRRSR